MHAHAQASPLSQSAVLGRSWADLGSCQLRCKSMLHCTHVLNFITARPKNLLYDVG